MTDQATPDYTAKIAERTVVITWPSNDRGGATPPPDGWANRAMNQEPTLYEVDEGSISGCSALRWRDDSRPDAELVAHSLMLVTGQKGPTTPAAPLPPADQTTPLRDRIAETLHQDQTPPPVAPWKDELPLDREYFLRRADAVLAVLPAPAGRAAVPSAVVRKTLRRWAYAAGHIESELDGAVDRMYELVARDVRRRMADETATTETQAHPVQHAPGKAIRCPDCRDKGYTVCLDEPADDTVHGCPGRWGGPDCRCFDDEPAVGARQDGADRG
ncbi:hypothetical protein [Streptomyces rochei]|uniref:hypothetical protein n=1 Tax=Streptomyces rochei TaxID=1928 RepID=UPI003530AFBC